MKKSVLFSGIFVIGLIGFLYVYYYPRLGIATGFASKMVCSCHFISGRDKDEIKKNVLHHSILPYVQIDINEAEKSVTSSFFGLKKKRAYYKTGVGCVLSPNGQRPDFVYTRNDVMFDEDTLASDFEWVEGVTSGVDKQKLMSVVETAFDDGKTFSQKRTSTVLVIHRDTMIAEMYAPPVHKDMPQLGWSMTKSLMNTFAGLMVLNGKVDPAQNSLFPEWVNDERKNITLNDLLFMNSGLEWNEDYEKVSDVTSMLYESPNVAVIPLSKKQAHKPATFWMYSSGTSNLVSKYLRDRFGNDEAYHSYMYRRLFKPLGMESVIMETDATGNYIGSSYTFATARDWAKFGMLYKNNGMWMGKRILPEHWVQYTTSEAQGSDGQYGAHFWLGKNSKTFPSAPKDMFYADGYQGQFVLIIPSYDLVIVRLGYSDFDADTFLKKILEVIPKKQ